MGESIQLYDDMAEKGIKNKDAFINKAKELYRGVFGIGNPEAEYYKESMKTPEGIKQYFMDFTSIEEDPRTKDYAESAPAYEGFRGGGGVGSLNETARNMFRSSAPGGDISPVPRGENINLEEIREEMSDRFGDTASQYGNENLEKGIGFFRSAGKDFPEGGGAHYIRQGADYLSDMGKAGIYTLAGAGEKGVALSAEVIDNIASYLFNTAGEEKLADDMIGMLSETPVFGPLIGRAAAFNKKTVVRNADPGAYKGQLFKDLSETEKLRKEADKFLDLPTNVKREMQRKTVNMYKRPPSFMDDLIDPSKMRSNFGDIPQIIKNMRIKSKFSEIDMLEKNLKDVGQSAEQIQNSMSMQKLLKELKALGAESKAGGGMVGIGAYEQYMA